MKVAEVYFGLETELEYLRRREGKASGEQWDKLLARLESQEKEFLEHAEEERKQHKSQDRKDSLDICYVDNFWDDIEDDNGYEANDFWANIGDSVGEEAIRGTNDSFWDDLAENEYAQDFWKDLEDENGKPEKAAAKGKGKMADFWEDFEKGPVVEIETKNFWGDLDQGEVQHVTRGGRLFKPPHLTVDHPGREELVKEATRKGPVEEVTKQNQGKKKRRKIRW